MRVRDWIVVGLLMNGLQSDTVLTVGQIKQLFELAK